MKGLTNLRRTLLRGRGFTLIELMVALAIATLLLALAVPGYQNVMQRAHRAHARSAVVQAAQWMERAATASGRYPVSADIPAGLVDPDDGCYTLHIVAPDPLQASNQSYRITALRSPGTPQAGDACGDYTMDQSNRRENDGMAPGHTSAACWGQ